MGLQLAAPAIAQICGPLDDGRVADAFYEGTAIFWTPVVDYREMVLTISGPCEDIVKVFGKGEQISFDIREITKVTDGTYTWQLRRVSNIDPAVQEKIEGARGTGEEDAIWWSFFQKGAIPEGPYVESASFTVDRGVIIDPNSGPGEKRAAIEPRAARSLAAAGMAAGADGNGLAPRDQVIPDDLIVQGSACVGFDCVNNESFGFDTIRLKENNTRIQFNDTSSTASYPTNNWQIRANSSSNGGASFLGFVDQNASDTSETGTLVFAVEADAGANALYIDSTSRVGLGTSTPVLDLHISSTNTPGLRLEQTNGGGFTAQTWDIAGNEANFFVRDVTGGSTLPLRIRPGAPTSSVDISADGDVGIGTASPDAKLEVVSTTAAAASVRYTNTSATGFPGGEYFENTTQGLFVGLDNANNLARINAVNSYPLVILTNSSERIRFPAPGGNFITAANGASLTAGGMWADASSRELKQDIVALDATEALAAVAGLVPVKFQYKSEPGEQYVGFISEEVPDLVARNDQKSLTPMDIVGVLTKVVQEQQKTIEELSLRLEELEGQEK